MNQLPTLIEYLLLTHDYVVIPGMGTFMVQQIASRRNEEEEAFLPPIRSVRFNAGLDHDDNLLSDSIAHIYNVSEEQAEQMLCTWIAEYMQMLEDEGDLDFGSVGVFSHQKNRTILFTSQESGIASPDNYGLDAFHMSEVQPERKAKLVPLTASMETDDKEITIRINRRIANVFVAACAAILLFIVFNSPMPKPLNMPQYGSIQELLMGNDLGTASKVVEVKKTQVPTVIEKSRNEQLPTANLETVHEADDAANCELSPKNTNHAAAPEMAVSTTAETTEAPKMTDSPKIVKEPVSTVAPKVSEQVQTEHTSSSAQYCIVMASAISKKNAEAYAARLKSQGFNNPRVLSTSKITRVVIGNYDTELQAYNVAEAMRQHSPEFNTVWILKL